MKRFFIITLGVISMFFLAGMSVLAYVGYDIFAGDYEHLEREKILDILSRETVVYYADGQNQLGSLFGTEHRQYVLLKDMPKHLLDATVASEDESFYSHIGIDVLGTLRAAYRNIVHGRREGASTITQQTVKNLYGRPVTNLQAKFVEAINSFKLERKYTKEEILEFYLNQFHVTGNGRGIGIAAKYYFDKEVHDLTLTEASFIVGSVKGPERYNPFTKRSQEAQEKARNEAKNRKNYVLRRMLENKFISEEDYNSSKEEDVPFKQGRFQFNELFVTELVRRQVARPEVLSALGVENVDELASMGLRITTTIEKAVQVAAQYGVRQNLSRLEMILSGFQKEQEKNFTPIQRPEKYWFYVGKIKELNKTNKQEIAKVSLGVPECTVPTDGIDRVARITDQSLMRGFERSKKDFLNKINVDEYALVSIRDIAEDGTMTCDFERKPRIQGALIVLDKGKVISMVGGYSPHEYNRAIFAKRQPGSTFKTLTYYSALQLGWHVLEPLLNVRNVYNWQGQFYYPRPDHPPESIETTFAGAGAKSENLASIWLLAHLLDKLTYDQFRDLLDELEIMPRGASDLEIQKTAANKFNVKLSDHNLKGGIFSSIRGDLLNDVTIVRDETLKAVLRSMNYGHGFEAEINRVKVDRGLPPKERLQRSHLLKNTLLRWQRVRAEALANLDILRRAADADAWSHPDVRAALSTFRLSADGNSLSFISVDSYEPNPIFGKDPVYPNIENPKFKMANIEELTNSLEMNGNLLSEDGLMLDGVMPVGLLREIVDQMNAKFESLSGAPFLEKLYWHDDFRYSVGMIYAANMTTNMGIESEVQWVPSFPLGANVVTLAELALAYQTMSTGTTYKYFNNPQSNQILLVKRIEDAQGQLLWEAESEASQLVDEFYSAPMLSVLRATVTNGTGRTAHNNVILRSNNPEDDKVLQKAQIRVPTFGKTGTTNDYVNATYVGFLPYPAAEGANELSAENMYTVAAYVGYDTNEPMRKRGFKVQGGSGALPAWIETAVALVKEQNYAQKMGWKKLVENKVREIPFDYESNTQVTVPIHSSTVYGTESENPEDKEKLDVNTFIDDYNTSRNQTVKLWLPGRVSDSVFIPTKRVSFFKARREDTQTAPIAAPRTEDSEAEEESIESSLRNVEAQVKKQLEVKPQMPEDNLEDLKYEDLEFPLPTPPP